MPVSKLALDGQLPHAYSTVGVGGHSEASSSTYLGLDSLVERARDPGRHCKSREDSSAVWRPLAPVRHDESWEDFNEEVANETKQEKWNRGLDLFVESVLKPDPQLRQCAHNQRCYHELMDVRADVLSYLKTKRWN